jgi:hypothetical protein
MEVKWIGHDALSGYSAATTRPRFAQRSPEERTALRCRWQRNGQTGRLEARWMRRV